jgi:hypothetical protein
MQTQSQQSLELDDLEEPVLAPTVAGSPVVWVIILIIVN